jgi:hypothetical protein
MLESIMSNRNKYHKIISDYISDFTYRGNRYNEDYSVAIMLCDADINLGDFLHHTRQTDKFIVLERNFCCVVLDSSPSVVGIKAASNIQTEFQNKNFGKELFTCVVTFKDYDDEYKMINSLFDILEYTLSYEIDNIVVDQNLMQAQNH